MNTLWSESNWKSLASQDPANQPQWRSDVAAQYTWIKAVPIESRHNESESLACHAQHKKPCFPLLTISNLPNRHFYSLDQVLH